jgi:hypothetical protein
MSDEAERIRRQMKSIRQELGDDVKGIVDGARQLSDWRYYVRRHPWLCVGSAFALGVLAVPGRRKPSDEKMEKILDQLRTSGLAAAAMRSAPPAGGLAARAISIAGPFLARQLAGLVAQQMGGKRRHDDAANATGSNVAP